MNEERQLSQAERGNLSGSPPYSPSWIDRFTDWVDRLPLPNWAFYLFIWLALFAVVTLLHWQDGSYPPGTFYPLHFVLSGTIPYTAALIHALDKSASHALLKFRPTLNTTDAEYAQLNYRLTTLPPRQTIVASLIAVVLTSASLFLAPDEWSRPATFQASDLARGFTLVLNVLMYWLVGTFVYHTVHQLRLVSQIYTRHTQINLFRLMPLYAFSDLSARTTVGFLFAIYAWYAVLPNTFARTGNVISAIIVNVLAAIVFVWPLLGIHRLLVDEKGRLLAETSRRMEMATEDLYVRMDSGKPEGIENIVKGMEGLEIHHKAVSRISTWPWSPETSRGLVAALLFPLIVYLGQWILQRILGS